MIFHVLNTAFRSLQNFGRLLISAILVFNQINLVYSEEFDTSFIVGGGATLDVSPLTSFSQEGHLIDLHILSSSEKSVLQLVYLISNDNEENVYCFDRKGVESWGVAVPIEGNEGEINDCVDINSLIPGVKIEINLKTLTGYVKIPDSYMSNLSPESSKWDYGVAGAFLKYSSSMNNIYVNNNHDLSLSASIESGINISNWQVRHSGFYSANRYELHSMYIKTDIDRYHSGVFLGEINTSPSPLGGFSFLGMKISSDIAMQSQNTTINRPRVFGLAETNASVKLLSNGRIVHQSIVSPGVFYIDDVKSYGPLEMVIEEVNGVVKRSTLPDMSMDDPDWSQYEFSVGKYSNKNANEPFFILSNYQFRMSEHFGLSIGGITSNGYAGIDIGTQYYTDLGDFYIGNTISSLDEKISDDGKSLQGHKVRVSHRKNFSDSSTHVSSSYNRNLDTGYLSFTEYMNLKNSYINFMQKEKDRLDISMSQNVFNGNFFSRVVLQRSNANVKSKSYHIGYNHRFSWGGVSPTLTRQSREGRDENIFMLTLDFLLDMNGVINISTTISKGDNEHGGMQTSLSGSYGEQQQNSYHISESRSISGSNSRSYAAGLQHKTQTNQFGIGLSRGENYYQQYFNTNGSILAINNGLFLSHNHPETISIVSAKGAEGALVNGNSDLVINDNGNAVYELTPYTDNSLSIEGNEVDSDIDVENGHRIISPRRGAFIYSDLKVSRNQFTLLKILDRRVSFGATVLNDQNEVVAQVAQGGLIYINTKYKYLKIKLDDDSRWCSVTNIDVELAKNNVDFNKYHRPVNVYCS
ncbi:fimbria/pilus outer membrane usher protein [Aeromonas veronii]|uniref:fimbria/pilus outer membrane usher protein n=1 Tax=Aeromonas veronii TaxID=654 RepID=UPI003B9F9199